MANIQGELIYLDYQGKFGEIGKQYNFSNFNDYCSEQKGYYLCNKEEYANELIQILSERLSSCHDNNKEKQIIKEQEIFSIKEDLKTILKYDDEFILVSINDNEVIIENEDERLKKLYEYHYSLFREILTRFINKRENP